jgi:hypothetical protein
MRAPVRSAAHAWERPRGCRATKKNDKFVSSHCLPPRTRHHTGSKYHTKRGWPREAANVRYGSKADMCAAKGCVCFTPESDIRCVFSIVCFGPIADLIICKQKDRLTTVRDLFTPAAADPRPHVHAGAQAAAHARSRTARHR